MQKKNVIEGILLILILLLLWYSIFVLQGEEYYYISLGIMLIGIIGFLLSFEKSRPTVALLAMIAALCAMAIVFRIAFFFFPQIKPMAAIVIIAGAAFGAETGFITGAVSAFVSNFYFGQGSWTPFQMFALGLIGFFAGLLFRKRKSRLAVMMYGFFSVIILYGGIVDLNTLFFMAKEPTPLIVAGVYLSALPFNVLFGITTSLFLFWLFHPMLNRLERIQRKYRLIDKSGKK
ncbi:MAG: ECF transporter S component [Lachnospiraceae bacterium]|nr:ECF transporter S component [Lachnospiraceae bacterium]